MANPVGGSIRETFGAVEAAWLAEHSPDPELRLVSRSIARDESRHTALAWRIDAWARDHVGAELLDEAMAKEVARLTTRRPNSAELGETLGLPTAAASRGMVDGLAQRLWARAA